MEDLEIKYKAKKHKYKLVFGSLLSLHYPKGSKP